MSLVLTRRAAALLLLAVAVSACRSGGDTAEPLSVGGRDALGELADALVGTFSNAEQAAAAPAQHESERLVIVGLWPRRGDGPWLLVERAVVRSLDRPHTLAVWRLAAVQEGMWRVERYDLPGDPAAYAGAFARPDALASLFPQHLVERPGCEILLSRSTAGGFHGATIGRGCDRDASGAHTAVQLGVEGERVTLWVRRHDTSGALVSGPSEPTLFDRQSRYAPSAR